MTQKPSIRRTWAPIGRTPVGRPAQPVVFQTKPGSYDTASLVAFLEALKAERPGRKCLLIWDGLPAHKSKLMQAHLHTQRHWLSVAVLPGYAPDLNPVELLWGNVKGQELANLCAADLPAVGRELRRGLAHVFLRHTGLTW